MAIPPTPSKRSTKRRSTRKFTYDYLVPYHVIAATLHSIMFVGCVAIALIKSGTRINLPFYHIKTATPKRDEQPMYPLGSIRRVEESSVLDLSVIAILIFISAVTAAEHLIYLLYRSAYTKFISRRTNPVRWISYATTAPLMAVIYSYFCGMVLYTEAVLVFVVVSTLMLTGYWAEREMELASFLGNAIVPFSWGCFMFLVYSCLTLRQFFMTSHGNDVPVPVYVLVFGLFLFKSSFSVPLLLRISNCSASRFSEELIYIALSLSSKALLTGVWLYTTLLY